MNENPDRATEVEPATSRIWKVANTAAVAGLCYAAVIALLAVTVSAEDYGWSTANVTRFGLVLIPLASVACVFRHSIAGNWLAGLSLVGAGFADTLLLISIRGRRFYSVEAIWSVSPLVLTVWAILWCAWQLALGLLFFRRIRFGLRTLFVLVVISTIPCAWASYSLHWIRQRRAMLDEPGVEMIEESNWSAQPDPEIVSWGWTRAPSGLSLFGEEGVVQLIVDHQHADRAGRLFPEAEIVTYQLGQFSDANQVPGDARSFDWTLHRPANPDNVVDYRVKPLCVLPGIAVSFVFIDSGKKCRMTLHSTPEALANVQLPIDAKVIIVTQPRS